MKKMQDNSQWIRYEYYQFLVYFSLVVSYRTLLLKTFQFLPLTMQHLLNRTQPLQLPLFLNDELGSFYKRTYYCCVTNGWKIRIKL